MTSTYISEKVHIFLLWDEIDLRNECKSFEPNRKTPAKLEEWVIFRIGVDEDSQDQDSGVDVQVVVEAIGRFIVALRQKRATRKYGFLNLTR